MHDMWYMLQNHETYAYHYTRPQSLISILETEKLRFSRFANLNDPRESKDWILNFSSSTVDLGLANKGLARELNQLLKHSWRVGCFASDPYEACVTKAREDRGEDTIGAPYERGHSRPRMWAQYADDYQGACLVFDRAKLDAAIRRSASNQGLFVCHDKVLYKNPSILPILGQPHSLTMSLDDIHQAGRATAVQDHVRQHWKELFMLKSRDWEQEREIRWLVSAVEDEDFYLSIVDCCVGIALGDRYPPESAQAVARYGEARGVSIAIMNWQNGFPQPGPTHWRILSK